MKSRRKIKGRPWDTEGPVWWQRVYLVGWFVDCVLVIVGLVSIARRDFNGVLLFAFLVATVSVMLDQTNRRIARRGLEDV